MRKALVTSLILSNILLLILVVSFLTGSLSLPFAGAGKSSEVERLRVSLIALDSELSTGLSVNDLRQRAGEILTNLRVATSSLQRGDWVAPTTRAIQTATAVADAWSQFRYNKGVCLLTENDYLEWADPCNDYVNALLKQAGSVQTVSFTDRRKRDVLVGELLTVLSNKLQAAIDAF